jgi:predicted transcriptional regulator
MIRDRGNAMTVTLSPELERFVTAQLKLSKCASVEELIIAALLDMRDVVEEELDDDTVAAINEGSEQADRGEFVDVNEIRAKINLPPRER